MQNRHFYLQIYTLFFSWMVNCNVKGTLSPPTGVPGFLGAFLTKYGHVLKMYCKCLFFIIELIWTLLYLNLNQCRSNVKIKHPGWQKTKKTFRHLSPLCLNSARRWRYESRIIYDRPKNYFYKLFSIKSRVLTRLHFWMQVSIISKMYLNCAFNN